MSSTHPCPKKLYKDLQAMSNLDLVLKCQTGLKPEQNVFTELVRRYQPYVEMMLYHLGSNCFDRADLAQEVWIRVYRNIKKLREPAKFHSWLNRITMNLFYNELRKRRRITALLPLDALFSTEDREIKMEIASPDLGPTEELIIQEFYEQLRKAIANLPEVFRTTIVLREIEGLTYQEIAEATGVSIGTVKTRILRARHRLQSQLVHYLDREKFELALLAN